MVLEQSFFPLKGNNEFSNCDPLGSLRESIDITISNYLSYTATLGSGYIDQLYESIHLVRCKDIQSSLN